MSDDKTLLLKTIPPANNDADQTLYLPFEAVSVGLCQGDGEITASYIFSEDFSAGRAPDNPITINNAAISRHHLQVKKQSDGWWLYDTASANGLFIEGERVLIKQKLVFPVSVFFGHSDLHLNIALVKQTAAPVLNPDATVLLPPSEPRLGQAHIKRKPLTEAEAKARFLADNEAHDAGDYTKMLRKIIHQDRAIRKKSHHKIIALLTLFFCLAIALAIYQHIALNNTQTLAIDLFYDMKALEVSIAQTDVKLEDSAKALEIVLNTINEEKLHIAQAQIQAEREKILAERQRMSQERKRLAAMKEKYQQYLAEARALKFRFPSTAAYEDDLILKVARELGESELELPDDFLQEVKKYIQYWQASPRIPQTLNNIRQNQHLSLVLSALGNAGLPPYFMYLPLQESGYDDLAIGPKTRFGIAKGAWQLLPATAQQYGLATGPLTETSEYDSQDQRFDFALATTAATRYLKYIYSTEAQASGLLVMSSYNYGDTRVKNLIKQMPDNPREKNFWKFIQRYELPKQTHDYVFYIFAAAVIGEDPEHFGFNFLPPLFRLSQQP
ncbi:MAG: transglycosylase SLT domain-containing protein [Methylococcaceae bacterium]|jgi:hypothetical protein